MTSATVLGHLGKGFLVWKTWDGGRDGRSLYLHPNTGARKWGLDWLNGKEVDESKTENLGSS
jgi:hypothetical protein